MPSKALEMGVCFQGGLLWGTWGDGPFLGPSGEGRNFLLLGELLLGNSGKKVLETGNSFHRAPVGEPGGGSFTETFERHMKEGSGNGAFLINPLNPELNPIC
jgi:hypothetical protein